MNEQLQNALAEIIKSLTAAAEQVGTVAKEQLPLLVQEYLAWGYWGAVLDIAIWAAASVALVTVSLLLWRTAKRVSDDFEEVTVGAAVIASIATVIVLVFTVFVVADAISTLVQISVAPRVYLLEQVSQLVK